MGSCDEASGVVFEFEQAAMRGEELPKGLCLEEQLLFLSLRKLYAERRADFISREMGVRDKRQLVGQFQEFQKKVWFGRRCWEHAANLWRGIEYAANAYQKDRTLEHADALIKAIYGVGIPKDNENPKRLGI